MPKGIYLGIKIKQKDHPISWKVDVWALEDKDFMQSQRFMQNMILALTPELRNFIIHWKL